MEDKEAVDRTPKGATWRDSPDPTSISDGFFRNATTNLQIQTEIDIYDLMQEMEMSIYWNLGGNSPDAVNLSGFIPIEITGVVHMLQQVQYVRRIHERLTAIYRSLGLNQSDSWEAECGNWLEDLQSDRREQVGFFQSIFEAEQSKMQLTDTTAAVILSEIDFWSRRPSEVTAEEMELMENIKATVNSTLNATENVEIPVKPNHPSDSAWKINPREIDVKFYEGGGVYHGEWQVAPVDVRKVNSPDRQSVGREAEIWSGLNHPHIASLLGVVTNEDGMLFITEPAEHGNLIKYKESHKKEVWQKLHEVGLALEYLHERGIIHGELKPDNIRIGRDGRAKLTGFECSMTLGDLAHGNIVAQRGDSRWHSPERLSNSELSFASDVYSFAMCIIAVVSGAPPFGANMSDAEIGEQVKTGSLLLERPNEFNDDQWNLVEKMYCFQAEARMTVYEVLQELTKFATEEKVAAKVNVHNDPLKQQADDRGQWADTPLTVKGDDGCPIVQGSLTSITSTPDTNNPLTIPLRELFVHECERCGGTAHVSRHVGSWLNSEVIIEYLRSNTEIDIKHIGAVWFSLKHPNVLQLYGICETGNRQFFICEYPTCGNLCSYLIRHKGRIWHTLLDIALGLRYLHSCRIVHGDLKCHNFLVDRGGKVKLAGLVYYISVSKATTPIDRMLQEGEEEEKENDTPRTQMNSRWRAPECRGSDAEKDSLQSDVYSFGKCIVEALTGELPEGNHKPDFVTTGCLPNAPPSMCSHHQWNLIKKMCAKDPAERPSMSAVVQQIARFIAVEEAVRRTRNKEVLRVLQSTPDLEVHLHAMVLDRMAGEEEKYAADENKHQQTLRNLSNIALDITSQMGDFRDFEEKLMNYKFRACKAVESNACQQNIHYGDALGSGAFAEVYRGEWIGTQVAIKRWIKNDDDAVASFDNEVRVWYPLNHPHIINLYGACRILEPNLNPMCVCDFAKNGKVSSYLSKPEHKQKVWQILYEAALGLQGVYARGVIHADLKCGNILVTANGKAKINDFGLSFLSKPKSNRSMDNKENDQRGSNELVPTTASRADDAVQWRAPEFLCGDSATKMSDTYSFGMCIIEAVTGSNPWGGKLDPVVKRSVKKGELPKRHINFKEDVQWNLVKAMCCRDPKERPPLDDVVRVLRVLARRSNQAVNGKMTKA